MKTKKKTTLKKSVSVKTEPTQEVPKTIREQVELDFFKDILNQPYKPVSPKTTLYDFVPKEHKAWAEDYVLVFLDSIYMKMKISAYKYKKKPVVELLDYLEKQKRGRIFHGWK